MATGNPHESSVNTNERDTVNHAQFMNNHDSQTRTRGSWLARGWPPPGLLYRVPKVAQPFSPHRETHKGRSRACIRIQKRAHAWLQKPIPASKFCVAHSLPPARDQRPARAAAPAPKPSRDCQRSSRSLIAMSRAILKNQQICLCAI